MLVRLSAVSGHRFSVGVVLVPDELKSTKTLLGENIYRFTIEHM